MKKKIVLIGISIIIIIFLFSRGIYNRINQNISPPKPTASMQEKDRITVQQATTMLSVLLSENSELEVEAGDDPIEGYITYGECLNLIQTLGYESVLKKLSYSMEELDQTEEMSQAEWLELYDYLMIQSGNQEVVKQKIYIVGEPDGQKDNKKIVTSQGVLDCTNVPCKAYIDKTVTAYMKKANSSVKGQLIFLYEETDVPVTLQNVWLIEGSGTQVKAFVDGCTRTFQTNSILSNPINRVVGDLNLDRGKITSVTVKPEVISGKVLVANDAYIEVEGYGKLELAPSYKIYRTYDELTMELTNAILIGYTATDFVVAGGKICAALIKEAIQAKNIRVLIKTNDFKDILHEKVKLTVDCDFTVYYGKKKKAFKKGKAITLTIQSKLLESGRIRVETEKDNSKITLLSVTRNGQHPEYRGTMEVAVYENRLTVINELPLEEYLYAVIPSEMPTSYDIEALKVQAICARSYAYKQLVTSSCGKYGAHVDDSVSYQVYNNIPEDEASILAVKDTYGKVLEYDGDIISAYYFSTSCGYTSSADEVWMSTEPLTYLSGKLQTAKKNSKALDLTDEATFRKFISENTYKTYDSEFAWYRWKVKIGCKDLKKVIDANLKSRYETNPNLILTRQENGTYASRPIDTIGTVEDIQVTKRQTGGIATEIIIKGSQETIKVTTEYNIRTLLAPRYNAVTRQDKSSVENLSMLPSAFIYIDSMKKDGKVIGFTITGGGYGHGVGMSQNGVKAMADSGTKFDTILKYYYDGIEIGNLY